MAVVHHNHVMPALPRCVLIIATQSVLLGCFVRQMFVKTIKLRWTTHTPAAVLLIARHGRKCRECLTCIAQRPSVGKDLRSRGRCLRQLGTLHTWSEAHSPHCMRDWADASITPAQLPRSKSHRTNWMRSGQAWQHSFLQVALDVEVQMHAYERRVDRNGRRKEQHAGKDEARPDQRAEKEPRSRDEGRYGTELLHGQYRSRKARAERSVHCQYCCCLGWYP